MTLTKYVFDKRRCQRRQIIPEISKAFRLRQIVVNRFDPRLPLGETTLADIRINEELLFILAGNAGHTTEAARISVLNVDFKAILSADIIKIIDPFTVLIVIGSVYFNDGVNGFTAAIDHTRNRKLQFADDFVLLVDGHTVRFDQSVFKLRYVLITDTPTV